MAINKGYKVYDVIEAYSMLDLIDRVNDRLNNGWKCQGGPLTVYSAAEDTRYYFQAVIHVSAEVLANAS